MFDDAYLLNLYRGNKFSIDILGRYAARRSHLQRQPKPRLIWLEYEVFPWLPWLIEKAFLPSGVPFVADYDDAVFHRYDLHKLLPVRWVLSKKIDRVMRHAGLVTAGNNYLIDRAYMAGAGYVKYVPTVVNMDTYQAGPMSSENEAPTVGWIGTPETWKVFGAGLYDTIEETLQAHNARFRSVGGRLVAEARGTLEFSPWTEQTEVTQLRNFDIGVMPLSDSPWARGKCGYKLIQYMACGVPVVASPVGVNSDIVEHGVNGFLATTEIEWREAITTLLRDRELRLRMGQAGRKKVEAQYSLQVWGPRVANLLREVADRSGRLTSDVGGLNR